MSRPYAAVYFDLDGTLIESYLQDGRPIHPYGRVVALPGRIERLALLRQAGVKIGIASNQGGVGAGHITPGQAHDKRRWALDVLDLWGHGVPALMSFYHPDHPYRYQDDAADRKPEPGMLIKLATHFMINPAFCLYVGDRGEDQAAAGAAGMDFCHADYFFSPEAIRPMNDWPIPMREDRPAGRTLVWTRPDGSPPLAPWPPLAPPTIYETPEYDHDSGSAWDRVEIISTQPAEGRTWRPTGGVYMAPVGTPPPEAGGELAPPWVRIGRLANPESGFMDRVLLNGEAPQTTDPQGDGRYPSPQAAQIDEARTDGRRPHLRLGPPLKFAMFSDKSPEEQLAEAKAEQIEAINKIRRDQGQAPSPFADGPGDRTVYDANNLPPPIPDDLADKSPEDQLADAQAEEDRRQKQERRRQGYDPRDYNG